MKNTIRPSPNINSIKKRTKDKFDAKHYNYLQDTIGINKNVKHKREFALCNDESQINIFHCEKCDINNWMHSKCRIGRHLHLTKKELYWA